MNMLVNFILNSLVFYDLQCLVALERWKTRYKADFPAWVDAVGEIECLNSLATYAFNNPDYIYPSPVESGGTGGNTLFIEAGQLAHPLIPGEAARGQ